MKIYAAPEFEMKKFGMTDVITTSAVQPGEGGNEPENATKLKTSVGGNNAVSYGTQDVSIFD